MSVLGRRTERVQRAGLEPRRGVAGDADAAGDFVRRLEADAPDLAREPVGLFANDAGAAVALGIVQIGCGGCRTRWQVLPGDKPSVSGIGKLRAGGCSRSTVRVTRRLAANGHVAARCISRQVIGRAVGRNGPDQRRIRDRCNGVQMGRIPVVVGAWADAPRVRSAGEPAQRVVAVVREILGGRQVAGGQTRTARRRAFRTSPGQSVLGVIAEGLVIGCTIRQGGVGRSNVARRIEASGLVEKGRRATRDIDVGRPE